MKITPLEIRQKDFEKKLRGYDKDEVNAFLQSLSNEWERVLEENKELNLKLQHAEGEVKKLREVESSLYKTLKTAEDTGANVIEQANKAAELHMKETQMNAEALLNESKNKSRAMIEQAEVEARQIIEELQEAVKSIEQNHRDIENHRQMALQELKNLSVTLIEKVERNTTETKEFRFDDYVQRVKKLARASEERIKSEKTVVNTDARAERVREEEEAAAQIAPKPLEDDTPKSRPQPPSFETKAKPILDPETPKENTQEERTVGKKTLEEKAEQLKNLQPKQPKEPAKPKEATEEKKGPRISRTVSFFDEIDTDT